MLAESRNKFLVSLSQEEEDLLVFSLTAHMCPEAAKSEASEVPAVLGPRWVLLLLHLCRGRSQPCRVSELLPHPAQSWQLSFTSPWCKRDCMEHPRSLEAATEKGVQAAIAGLGALVLHAALQALHLLHVPSPARPGMLCCSHHHGENHTHWQLQTFSASCTPLLSLFFPILAEKTRVFLPLSLAVPLPGFSCPITAAEQSCPQSSWVWQGCAGLPKCSSKPRAERGRADEQHGLP